MMKIDFKEKTTLGGGWSLEVRTKALRRGPSGGRKRPMSILIGHIRRRPSGGYAYFPGSQNQMTPSLTERDLEALKEKVRANPRPLP